MQRVRRILQPPCLKHIKSLDAISVGLDPCQDLHHLGGVVLGHLERVINVIENGDSPYQCPEDHGQQHVGDEDWIDTSIVGGVVHGQRIPLWKKQYHLKLEGIDI